MHIVNNRCQRVLIGYTIEIDSSAEKMTGGVCQEKLHGRSGVPHQLAVHPIGMRLGIGIRVFGYGGCLDCMVEYKLPGIVGQLAEIPVNGFVAAMNSRVQRGIDNIDPVAFILIADGLNDGMPRV